MIGFDFRIRLDAKHRPNGLVYMTPMMRSNLLRFGDILFLDAQKRGHNSYNWPYIGPVIKDHNLKIGLVAESIVIAEDLDTYAWILRSMSEMEPRWKLADIRVIFGDQFITPTLLINLGIQNSCLLRGDYYHLMKEVWPTSENFGSGVMAVIGKWLQVMISSPNILECERAYQLAATFLKTDPRKLNKLKKIHNNSSYYCGYVLRAIRCNLKSQGSVPAEQNHSSVIAYLGKGNASSSIMVHASQLMKRAQEHSKQRKEQDNRSQVNVYKYTSKLLGQLGIDDTLARKSLSPYAYKMLYLPSSQRASYMMSDINTCDNSINVWPAGLDKTLTNCFKMRPGNICHCQFKIDWGVQCAHELCADKKFILSKFDSRWLQTHVFLMKNPHLSPTNVPFKGINTDYEFETSEQNVSPEDEETNEVDNPLGGDDECSIDMYCSTNQVPDKGIKQKVTFQDLMEVFKQLATLGAKTSYKSVF